LRRFRKAVSVGAEVTSGGRLFERRLPATGNARSPTRCPRNGDIRSDVGANCAVNNSKESGMERRKDSEAIRFDPRSLNVHQVLCRQRFIVQHVMGPNDRHGASLTIPTAAAVQCP